ncbi:CLD19 protein, partial [Leiothrix lutea]|nr:CLD19 protein [Leiothrix lutea]
MGGGARELAGYLAALAGWMAALAAAVLPHWRQSSYAGDAIITAVGLHEGLWMSCAAQSTGQVQCRLHDSLLSLEGLYPLHVWMSPSPVDLSFPGPSWSLSHLQVQVLRATIPVIKPKSALASSGLRASHCLSHFAPLSLCPSLLTPRPFHHRYEFGSALFVGWGAASLSLLGGSLLCCSWPAKERRGQHYRRQAQPSTAREYV